MSAIVMAVAGIAVLVNLACFIAILIKLFQREGTGSGIFGLICGLYTYYWGWKNATYFDMQAAEAGSKPAITVRGIMMLWTASWAVQVVLNVMMR
jgi:hypothetical protein